MHSRKRKILIAFIIILILAIAGTGTVYAYLSAKSDTLSNNLTLDTEIDPAVQEQNGVYVNVGNPGYAVYVRVAIVANWVNGFEVYAEAPQYTITGLDSNYWFESGGFYYYKPMVESGSVKLCDVITSNSEAPDGYELNVQVIAQTIQALGTTDEGSKSAVFDAWGVSMNP